jgi:hypothetical protein
MRLSKQHRTQLPHARDWRVDQALDDGFPFICRVWRRVLRGGVPYSRALERLMRYVRLQNEGP